MTEKRRLVFKALNYLAMIENSENQSIIRQIEGLLYEILNSD